MPPGVNAADESYMRLALAQARLAGAAGEVPVGAVVVLAGEVIGAGANRTRRDGVVHAHAELVALGEAERRLGDFRLDNAAMYVTLEPCLMCLGAIHQARLGRVVYGAPEPKFGALGSRFDLRGAEALRRLDISSGVLAGEAAALLGEFFKALREGQ
jgi:tRNA(adenine34) deaminase